jgi:hypothetical protein
MCTNKALERLKRKAFDAIDFDVRYRQIVN